ncbi:hypothetical protein A2631_02415 [Candidatus Daviesbacteria bacterium RIFCSPHIGHO2_01_FULL_44_29]|uniref:Aspartyl/glutamyl-tRNA(Asn/Gln) amidotransferase subunit C n=1 Tax=Candidatus Daviesbacteria bacterium RIFCSPHIGHO2_02_FULL_43_12 TaxID=1797776 RepID=A0A1F5KKC9_9BACT|nr:MAG: hypothetical protein A2631_02415 [Candidatus Daviesbacteria bacterium RIFCSPHIGHO2_01_FULL_44_29]OGE41245.1 MAG: hypothetical protein A3D25_01810 [Candidatus Daviesbacteria bacterium RIFCSPHIGHO2_02_FULL_43_12]OGE41561.1 MAG: hypothetical protein A3E86_00240 [Candidatus Daviesbacteria bacterium RIFCSPHIGHO2_12_FULL_47_45]OGE69446.1 MAG: hypothetical protein A3B55_03550 [Candidatus Daviesbacteria bacterium RIFCSPLOWO2_01_FULL_43_15]
MKLTLEQVKKVAKLAKLNLSESELAKYSEQLSKILSYIDQLNKVETSKIDPTYNVTGLSNAFSPDEIRPSLTQKAALFNAPQQDKGFFVTKGVFQEE